MSGRTGVVVIPARQIQTGDRMNEHEDGWCEVTDLGAEGCFMTVYLYSALKDKQIVKHLWPNDMVSVLRGA